jgi:hypothetical protein
MALTRYTERQKTLIVNNIVRACVDIEKLNRTGYKFIYLAQGFIAHYDLYGFRAAYSQSGSLAHDIMRNASINQWNNFHSSDVDYAYYMDKRDIYNRIVAKLTRYAA